MATIPDESFLNQPADHEAEDTPSRVYVNNVRLPAGDIDIHVRKEGDLDVTRYAEGEFASPHDGEDYVDAFDTLRPTEQTTPDTVRIDVRDRVTGEYHTEFHGLVTGVGNAADGGSSWWQFRAQGPGHRLSNIPASKPFKNASVSHVLQYVIETFAAHSPLSVSSGEIDTPSAVVKEEGEDDGIITVNVPFTGTEVETVNPLAGLQFTSAVSAEATEEVTGRELPADTVGPLTTSKTFQYGKHTLSDVVSFVSEKMNLTVWFQPVPSGVVLVATQNPHLRHHTADYLGGNTRVVSNFALSELIPVNSQILKAEAKKSVEDVNTYQRNESSETIVRVKARSKPLYRRAGGVELHAETHRVSNAMSKVEAENEAREILADAIGSTTAGGMTTLLRSPISPFDTLTAKPTANSTTTQEFDPLTYEISRVHHQITSSGSETKLTVGLHTDSMEDIEILDSWSEGA